jgi:hypothetical protein
MREDLGSGLTFDISKRVSFIKKVGHCLVNE